MKKGHIPLAVNQAKVLMMKLIIIQPSDIIIQQLDTTTQVLGTTILNRVWDILMIMKILRLVAAGDELVTCHTIDQNSNFFLNLRF